MLSDRPYLRDDYPKERTSVLTWMIAAIIGGFVLQLVLFSPWFDASSQLVSGLAVTISGLSQSHVWTLATHWLLHDQNNLFHVGLVAAGLFALGRELEPLLGPRKFVALFAASLVVGSLLWAAVNWRHSGAPVLLGGVAGVYGLLALYTALYPNREFSFLVLFVFPVTLRPKHVALSLMIIDLAIFALFEVSGNNPPIAYTPSAHLGGMFTGWVYYRYFHFPDSNPFRRRRAVPNLRPAARNLRPAAAADLVAPKPDSKSSAHLRAEVDRILDKINSHGFGAITADEKRLLDEAKDLLSRR